MSDIEPPIEPTPPEGLPPNITPPWVDPPEHGPAEEVTTPEVTMRRTEPPARPDDTSPYTQLGEMAGDATDAEQVWPLGGPQDGEPPRVPPSSLPPFLVGLIVGIALAAVSIVGFLVFRRDDGGTAAATTTTVTTVASTGTAATGSTVATVVIPTTLPTVTTLPAVPIPAVGDPVLLEDLAMGSSGLGDLRFGDNGDTTLGRLVATFGQPDQDTGTYISTGTLGTCDGDPVRFVRWGPLGVIVLNPDADPTFAAYRLDLGFGDLESLAADLRTVSGLRAGDSVSDLESIYADAFTVTYEVDPESGLEFQL
ncbi:MAG: hypothetical protein OES13_07345, partial [Acidimicrobiia bacterium]|nr:hypothetical protein [Acidimicrobiia bacterium]